MMSFIFSCATPEKNLLPEDKKMSLANTYYNNDLYEAAIREYEDYLQNYDVPENKQANTHYIIGNIYFDRLKDYNKALEHYFRIKQLYPQSSLQKEVGKKIVNCLERLQRSQDAQRVLNNETALKESQKIESRPGEVVARIGERKITSGDLDFEISQLPSYIRDQMKDKKQRLEFLKQFIMQELLYDSAKRKGLDKDKDVIEGTFRAQKGLMAQKIFEDEIRKQVSIKEADVELYYKAHKDKYVEKDKDGKVVRELSLQEAAQQAAQDLMQERQMEASKQLLDRLMKAENVKLFENKL